MGYAEIKEKYASAYQTNKSSSSRSSSSESRGSERSSSSSASSTSNSIWDTKTEEEKTYIEKVQEILNKCNDSTEVDAATAINNMAKSSLFEGENVKCYYDRMVRAAEKLVNNEKWRISMDTDGDGTIESVALADAVAASFDSELDLYIQDIVSEIMDKYGTCSKSYLGEKARKELAARGIRVDSVGDGTEEDGSITNRVYSFSLVELPENADEMTIDELYAAVYSDDAKIVEDANGKKANYLFADCLIPDGCAQGAEVHLSSILDQMGYDCISKADFIGREDEYTANLFKTIEKILCRTMGILTHSEVQIFIFLLCVVPDDLGKRIAILIYLYLLVTDRLQGKRKLIERTLIAVHIQRRKRINDAAIEFRQLDATLFKQRLNSDSHIRKSCLRYR